MWGTPGTNGQHAYYQFDPPWDEAVSPRILIVSPGRWTIWSRGLVAQHDLLMANSVRAGAALPSAMTLGGGGGGGRRGGAGPAQDVRGNRPTTTILADGADAVGAGGS
ncbi:hypothetical protein [Streptomyces thioluteus]|uniref:hypothetical protein n=1 Tax=Streptomyces thioluteus TaxID=66431 RepID=UPI0031EDDAFF